MKIILSLLTALFAGFTAYYSLDRECFYKFKIIAGEQAPDDLIIGKPAAIVLTIIVVGSVFAASQTLNGVCRGWIDIIKFNIALIVMAGSAGVDLREHRIPNFFPAVLAILGIVSCCLYYLLSFNGAQAYLISSVVATTTSVCGLLLVRQLSGNGIGLGDVKLLGALSLVSGVTAICSTLLYGISACAFVAIGLLLTKKAKKTDGLPFGPFLFVGYVISILTSKI